MFFKGKNVLIIGGTGTIGQSLLKYILLEEPNLVRIFSRDEYKQFTLRNKMGNRKNLHFVLGDVRNCQSIFSAMQDIDYVFHAAAMKHVPACEDNPYEAVLTNINGTFNVIKAAIAQNVKKVVITSSDKAISPTNTYGATKFIAERLIPTNQPWNERSKTTFASVRFGNVMGSRGSVIPLFLKQISENKRITVTDLKMTRFMMTLEQATKLTIKALKESKGGEVFVLKMPIIMLGDLVHVILDEFGKKSKIKSDEIKIEEIGLRKGEKRYEELMTFEESTKSLELEDMFIIPGIEGNHDVYPYAKKTTFGTYSSQNQSPLTVEEIRKLLISEQLI